MLKVRKVSDRNRNRFEIIAEILQKLQKPICKTNIMSQCNINTEQSGQYLNFMTSSDLIMINRAPGNVTYQRTEAGREFLKLFNKMALLLDPSISPAALVACMN